MRAAVLLLSFLVLAGCLGAGRSDPPAPTLEVDLQVVDTGYTGNEPSVGVLRDGTLLVAGIIDADAGPVSGAGVPLVVRSQDAGRTWAPVDAFPVTSDPIVHVDAATQRAYRAHMFSTVCTNLAWSDDGGTSWVQRPLACGEGRSNDFIKLGSGVPGPDANPLAADATHVLYLCHNRNTEPPTRTVCAMSHDGGLTWPVERVVAQHDRDGCGGITSFPVVSSEGIAVVPLGGGCRAFHFAVSRDSGDTWQVRSLPFGGGENTVTPRMAFDGATAYAFWTDYGGRVWVARSHDLADWERWEVTPPGVGAVTHVGFDVVGPGRVAFALLGSSARVVPSEAPAGTPWTLYGGGWSEGGWGVAAGAVVHTGAICYGGSACPRNLGDFFDAAAAPDGALWFSFVDGCAGGACGSQATGSALKLARVALAWVP